MTSGAHLPLLPSERKFGFFFVAVFGLGAAYAAHAGLSAAAVYGLAALAALVLAAAAWKPRLLAPFNRAWFRLGLLLGRIVGPIVEAILYFGLITPLALVMRLAGRDALRLRKREAASYWIERDAESREASSFRNPY